MDEEKAKKILTKLAELWADQYGQELTDIHIERGTNDKGRENKTA